MNYLEAGKEVLRKLNENGFLAYFVGGYVRDYILHNKENDIDITTNARPLDVLKLFECKPSGLKYGTVTVNYNGYHFEVTTFRKDKKYDDYRHPIVEFSSKLEDDLIRRDFTINAMAMDVDMNVIDLCNGKEDIENKIIKAVGNPFNRFKEDALRMLRACYFASKLDFDIESTTLNAMKEDSHLITKISSERIYNELAKLFNGNNVEKGLFYIKKSMLDYHLNIVKSIEKLMSINKNISFDLFLALTFYYNENGIFKLPNSSFNRYKKIIELLNCKPNNYTLFILGENNILLYQQLRQIIFNKNEDLISKYKELQIKDRKELNISNEEIISIKGLKPGLWIKEIEYKLIMAVLEKKVLNNNKDLKNIVKEEL